MHPTKLLTFYSSSTMDWTRGRTIGHGSSATVSIATSDHIYPIIAVKSTELAQSQLLQREQKILSSLSSPHVVRYLGYDVTTEDNKLMHNLLMEYVSRGTLTDMIRSHGGRLDESLVQYYTKQIVQGLDYLHANGLIHCDIKGRNILVGEEGLKISDFGCSRWANPAKAVAEKAVMGGTPMYMAPEVARGEEQGFPSDIWSLGCTVIEMTTGRSPWPNIVDPITVLYQLAYSDDLPEFPSFLSEKAKDFLGKCLRRNPKERWTTSELLNHPFLEEFNTCIKQIQESDSTSPRSILDEGIWNPMEESETFNEVVVTTSEISPADRLRRLSLFSGEPSWIFDYEDWITIREDDHADNGVKSEEVEIDMNSGSNMASVSCRIEQLERHFGYSEELLKFTDINISDKGSAEVLGVCSCSKNEVALENLIFERDIDKLLLPII